MRHPKAVRYAKYVSWLSGIAVSIGSAVSLPLELYRTFHALNNTDEVIMAKIDNVTRTLDLLRIQGQREFEEHPDPTIYDLYYAPLKRDSRGTYRLGIEDIPRSEDHPDVMDPLFQNITGLPDILGNVTKRVRTAPTSHLEKGHTLADGTPSAEIDSTSANTESFQWNDMFKNLSPRMIGWILIAVVGAIALFVYTCCVFLVQKCIKFLCTRPNHHRSPSLARHSPHEIAELDNLSTVNHVNVYEVVPR